MRANFAKGAHRRSCTQGAQMEVMMQRFMGAAAATALVFTLAACGSPPEQSAETAAATDAATVAATGAVTADPASASPSAAAPASEAPAPGPSASAAPSAAKPAPAVAAAAPAAPPASFMQCRACHAVEPGRHGIGPSLAGIYGSKAGDIPGYMVSEALKSSGVVWNDAALDKWLQGPSKMVPGTKMVYAGMPDAAKRAEVIAYMKALK
jgi:cytochrome c